MNDKDLDKVIVDLQARVKELEAEIEKQHKFNDMAIQHMEHSTNCIEALNGS